MLYSVGKDSSVMLHLAMKAFHPSKPPFPLLHVDTTWKFQDMYAFRDRIAAELGLDLLVHINQEGVRDGINPFDHGPDVHTHIMKTVGLRQALDAHGFDAAFGGVQRDGALIMVDDERMRLQPGEEPAIRKVRFRTLGCYPLTGAIESEAETLEAIILEMLLATTSERQGRVIDHDSAASMEKKKQEG